MSSRKERLTVTVDDALVRAGNEAVRSGLAPSLSAWVNAALVERVRKERRLTALGDAIAAYEAAHGEITEDDLREQRRLDRRAALHVGPTRPVARRKRKVA